jgi:predicted ester cyclase
MSELNKTVARRVAEEMLSGKPELVPELFDASLVKSQATLAQILHTAFPDLSLQVQDIVAEGDKVASRWVATGTHRGPFFGIPPTNERVTWTGMTLDRLEGGKIVFTKTNWDAFELFQKLTVAARALSPQP